MRKQEWKVPYRVVSIYDTETTNIGEGENTKAYPVLFIFNDLRDKTIKDYTPKGDKITFLRTVVECLAYIDELIDDGKKHGYVPIIAAYNAMFDLQPLLYELNIDYAFRVVAQSSTNIYTLDLLEGETPVLRFWDTFHLELGGLAAMGETCGIEKAVGDWDYTLIRTPETPLTEEELFYAGRDVQVIPAYLRYLMQSNAWLQEDDLGTTVLTKTSLVRQMAKNEIGKIAYTTKHKKKATLGFAFKQTCEQELPKDFNHYLLQKACFRGGFTFTSAAMSFIPVENVASLDVTSMHHAFINGRFIPEHFNDVSPDTLQFALDEIRTYTVPEVLQYYYHPFRWAFHACVEFTNIRLKAGSAFEKWQIGLIPYAKFRSSNANDEEYTGNETALAANENAASYIHDIASGAVFAFAKLYSAKKARLHINELEYWAICQVYDFDEVRAVYGEMTVKFMRPPDYVSLQSNVLFERKSDMKYIDNNYQQGVPYERDIPETIPEGIAAGLRAGTLTNAFIHSYYTTTVKGMFNGIYGTQAQDMFKPDFGAQDGIFVVDWDTVATPSNFNEKKPKQPKVDYEYGMRIVGGSRVHLVIAIILLYEQLGDRIDILGGDTDSLKIRTDFDVTDDMLLDALNPLHRAIENAIDITQKRIRTLYPSMASNLKHIGQFEVESCGDTTRYEQHMECWNKARVSYSKGKFHITCAGLSRPADKYNAEDLASDLIKQGYSFAQIAPLIVGWNVTYDATIAYSLERYRPLPKDRYEGVVEDYLGGLAYVDTYQSISLFPASRCVGETTKTDNYDAVQFLEALGRPQDTRLKFVQIKDGKGQIIIMDAEGDIVIETACIEQTTGL